MVIRSATLLSVAALVLSFTQPVPAQDPPIRVITSNAVRAVFEELLPKSEKAIGRRIEVEYNSTTALRQKIDAGGTFDVAILTSEGLDDLIKVGKIAAGTRADIARVGIGIGNRARAPKPDIHNSEALKQTLLKSKSITYASDGASRPSIEKMLDRFGITAEMSRKSNPVQGSTQATGRVADGQSEFVITLISEILPAKGVQLVGPLPAEVQNYVSFAAGIATDSKNTAAGQSLIRFLKSPAAAPAIKAEGMEPR